MSYCEAREILKTTHILTSTSPTLPRTSSANAHTSHKSRVTASVLALLVEQTISWRNPSTSPPQIHPWRERERERERGARGGGGGGLAIKVHNNVMLFTLTAVIGKLYYLSVISKDLLECIIYANF